MRPVPQKWHPNLPPALRRAWKELKNNPEFFVVKADKGGKIVMWRREDYTKEALRQLQDTSTYLPLTKTEAEARFSNIRELAKTLTLELRNGECITRAEADRFLQVEPKMPSIYFLPKIHKKKREDTNTFAGRPILAAVGGPLKLLDEFIAKLTSPLLKLIPGSLNDTRELILDLDKLGRLPPGSILFSADVESLYPSIDWTQGRQAATKFYAKKYYVLLAIAKKNHWLPPPKPALFSRILAAVLENNVFHFRDERWFQQLRGTAMGCSISVFLANTFMLDRTESLLKHPPDKLLYLGRYIDDLIGVWLGDAAGIPDIFSDTIDENIKLTFDFGGRKLEALDLLLMLGDDGRITTKLHRKPTDGHQFIHWQSSHPDHVKTSVLYSQLLRAKRNSSRNEDYKMEAGKLCARFRLRGYPEEEIEEQVRKAALVTRKELLTIAKDPEPPLERMVLVTEYHPARTYKLREWVKTFWDSLLQSPLITERTPFVEGPVLPPVHPMLAFRGGKSLGEELGPIFKRGDRTRSPATHRRSPDAPARHDANFYQSSCSGAMEHPGLLRSHTASGQEPGFGQTANPAR